MVSAHRAEAWSPTDLRRLSSRQYVGEARRAGAWPCRRRAPAHASHSLTGHKGRQRMADELRARVLHRPHAGGERRAARRIAETFDHECLRCRVERASRHVWQICSTGSVPRAWSSGDSRARRKRRSSRATMARSAKGSGVTPRRARRRSTMAASTRARAARVIRASAGLRAVTILRSTGSWQPAKACCRARCTDRVVDRGILAQ